MICCYIMAAAVSGPSTEILQFDWFISTQIFAVLPAQGGGNVTPCLCRLKSENVLRTIREVAMQSEVGELRILYENKAELQVFSRRSIPLTLPILLK